MTKNLILKSIAVLSITAMCVIGTVKLVKANSYIYNCNVYVQNCPPGYFCSQNPLALPGSGFCVPWDYLP